MKTQSPQTVKVLLRACLCGLLLVAAGCATTSSEESSMPWNTPQPWEGSPTIPGLSDR